MKCYCGHGEGWHFIDAMGCIGKDVCCYRSVYTDGLDCECRKSQNEKKY